MSDESAIRTARVRRKGPVVRPSRAVVREEESVDDAATVLAHSSRALRRLRAEREEDAEDARTVRVSRMPVSFIGESVTDPTTAMDNSEAAARWREQAGIDEIDLLTDVHSLDPDPPKRTPEPPVSLLAPSDVVPVVDEPAISTILISLLLGAVLGVGAVGLTAWFLL